MTHELVHQSRYEAIQTRPAGLIHALVKAATAQPAQPFHYGFRMGHAQLREQTRGALSQTQLPRRSHRIILRSPFGGRGALEDQLGEIPLYQISPGR